MCIYIYISTNIAHLVLFHSNPPQAFYYQEPGLLLSPGTDHEKAQGRWLVISHLLNFNKTVNKIDCIGYILLSNIEQSVERAAGDIVVSALQS